ncbi:MAG: hypothetical protein AB1393_02800 [Candidatus Edwardsbacteria bacterium]
MTKGYLGFYHLGLLEKIILGNYRITWGQGLLVDNKDLDPDESPYRVVERTCGLFGDATTSQEFTFRGVAWQAKFSRFQPQFFYSIDKRDALLNYNQTVNSFIINSPRLNWQKDKLSEKTIGWSLKFDLSDLAIIPLGSYLAFNGYESKYDRTINPDCRTLDLPGDTEALNDPNYTQLFQGKRRKIYGLDFRMIIKNFSLEGEYAQQFGGVKLIVLRREFNITISIFL